MGLLDLFKRKSADNSQKNDLESDAVQQKSAHVSDKPQKEAETIIATEPAQEKPPRGETSAMAQEGKTALIAEPVTDTKPVAEPKSDHAEAKHAEVKPVAKAKPAEGMMQARPIAVPRNGSDVIIRWPQNGTGPAWLAQSKFFVYADAGFLRSRGASTFIEAWRMGKEKSGSRRSVFVPEFELDRLTPEERERAKQWNDVCSIRTGQKDYEQLFRAVSQMKWNIVFLTEKGGHNNTIAEAAAAAGVSLRIYMVSEDGKIYAVLLSQTHTGQRRMQQATQARTQTPVNAFNEPMKLAKISRSVPPAEIPASGSVVYDDKGESIRLEKPVFSDSTSITYATNLPDRYAKIYTQSLLKTTLPEQKCRLMLSRRIEIPGVCWPVSGLVIQEGQKQLFTGILVPKAEGFQLREALLRESTVRESFAGWDRQDMTRLAITILKMIRDLQRWHVYFGRLNPSTVLVKDKSTVYFMDMDAWQIDGYPVLFENRIFDPPELQKEETGLRFFNQDEMNYQIAYLMFMLMMPGRLPYVRSGGRTVMESIIKQRFAFGMGRETRGRQEEGSNREAGAGFWRFVWDHVDYNLAKAFYHTFAMGGVASERGQRYSIDKWLNDMEAYNRKLSNPYDPESRKLYPVTFRRSNDRTFVKCDFCSVEHPSFYFCDHINVKNGNARERIPLERIIGSKKLCKTCCNESAKEFFPEDKRAYFDCEGCGDRIYYSVEAKLMHEYMENNKGWMPKKWCSNCSETYEMRTCIDCGEAFPVTVGRYKAFTRKGFALPRRCFECQKKKKGDLKL